MIKTLLTPPPCPSHWRREEGWLLLLASPSTEPAQVISLPHGETLAQGDEVRAWLEDDVSFLQKLNTPVTAQESSFSLSPLSLYHALPRPELIALAERGAFGAQLQRLALSLGSEAACYQVTPHHLSATLRQALSMIAAAGVPFKVSSPLSIWRQVALQELSILLEPKQDFELLDEDEERSLIAHITRDAQGLTLNVSLRGATHTLYHAEKGLSEEVWERFLKELSLVSGLPLWALSQGPSSLDSPPLNVSSLEVSVSDPSLPEVRDSLYMMDYEDAPSQQSDFGTLPLDVSFALEPSGEPSVSPLEELRERGADAEEAEQSGESGESGKTEEIQKGEKSIKLDFDHDFKADFEADEESSVFTELSLSEVEPHEQTEQNTEELLNPSPMERRLQEQLKQAKGIYLAPSSSFDLSAINLSESQMRAETSLFPSPDVGPTEPHLSLKGDPFIEDHHTFNEFPQDDPTLHRDLSESERSVSSLTGLDEASAPTRVDLNREMVDEALAQLAEEELTSTDAPPVPDYALSTAPTRARPLIKSAINTALPNVHEEETKVSELSASPSVLTEEAKERRKSFSDVVRRLKGYSQ